MAEKICPATGKECLAKCSIDYCWTERIVPVIAERINIAIENETTQNSQFDSIPEGNRQKLAQVLRTKVKKSIK